MAKHHDQPKNDDEERQQSNGQPPPEASFSPKEPEGRHSVPEEDEEE
ncbi:MAG: hypothetical protein ACRDTG_04015 [Pseudonocardiaceae bacterium]